MPPDLEGVRIPLWSRGVALGQAGRRIVATLVAWRGLHHVSFETKPGRSSNVEAGEEITITVNGRDVARLAPVGSRPRSIDSNVFLDMIEATQADPKLTIELDEMMGAETTDDLRW